MQSEPVICVVGLGYVGLPLAAAFGKSGMKVYGYDVSEKRIDALKNGNDWTNELTAEDLASTTIEYTTDPSVMNECNFIIVTVPTPIDEKCEPDLSFVESATTTIGKHLQKGTIVVYESTVYPGVTEEVCVPILEKESGLSNPDDFTVGYSPERINPGDKEHTVDKIIKVIAGQTAQTTKAMEEVYGKIITAGIYTAANIKAAELAKALENTQRDINIALMNEIARLCDKLGISTKHVIDAAKTKWNFLPFTPGLVGGHCIGVDPYYLVYKAKELGMDTHVITAGRKINDSQAAFISDQIIRAMEEQSIDPRSASALVLGLTFKENVPDTRNAKIHDVIKMLKEKGMDVRGHDPLLKEEEITALNVTPGALDAQYDVVVLAVAHNQYKTIDGASWKQMIKQPGILYDLRSMCEKDAVEAQGISYRSL